MTGADDRLAAADEQVTSTAKRRPSRLAAFRVHKHMKGAPARGAAAATHKAASEVAKEAGGRFVTHAEHKAAKQKVITLEAQTKALKAQLQAMQRELEQLSKAQGAFVRNEPMRKSKQLAKSVGSMVSMAELFSKERRPEARKQASEARAEGEPPTTSQEHERRGLGCSFTEMMRSSPLGMRASRLFGGAHAGTSMLAARGGC